MLKFMQCLVLIFMMAAVPMAAQAQILGVPVVDETPVLVTSPVASDTPDATVLPEVTEATDIVVSDVVVAVGDVVVAPLVTGDASVGVDAVVVPIPGVVIPQTPDQVGQQSVQAFDYFTAGSWIAGLLLLLGIALYFVNRGKKGSTPPTN